MEKKSERLEVRLGYQEKQEFTEACDTQGDTPSGAVRRFIKGYVKRSDEDILSSAWRVAAKRRSWRPAVFALGFITIGVMFWALVQKTPMVSDEAIFAARDINGDGQLKGAELDEKSATLLKFMDIDSSGGITLDEFVSKGYMAYVLAGAKDDLAQKFILRDGEYIVAIKFDIGNEYIINKRSEVIDKFVYQSGEVQLENLDRIVFWHKGGGVTVLNGPAGLDVKVGRNE